MTKSTPFHKILIANRGEIARRIQRTARALGWRTVAVHSTADSDALHVREADQAVCIGQALPAQSYLNIAALLDAARACGADALHPGYGFLAENAEFAQACRDAGLVFIGPSPEAIRAMGNKAAAKILMEQAGVPCVPGYSGESQGEERLAQEAARIGYPVMIKASAGGGGRGMRLVERAEDFSEALRSARSEAQNAFGDPHVILERAIIEPRHIEIQVFADRHGNAIHLGERDCSVQRRHQKLIEEAPSPAVSADLRARMGAVAVQALRAIGYEGAGTLEFLLDADGNFYFMEMNTRLQVEHPVTEAITGLDLVEWQLRVAAGEALPLRQEQVQFCGHAIEVRLCAEDAAQGFMPQSGQMAFWQVAENAAHGIRVEHAMHSGAQIPPYYDSMIAKIIAHGDTRAAARRKLLAALHDSAALGVITNQHFLQRCLAHPAFAAGAATTGFIAAHEAHLLTQDKALHQTARAIAAALLCATSADGAPAARPEQRLTHRLRLELRALLNGQRFSAPVRQPQKNHFALTLDGTAFDVAVLQLAAPQARVLCNGVQEAVFFWRDGAQLWLHWRGQPWQVQDETHAASARAGANEGDGTLRASMNGRVVAIHAAVGDQVQAGQAIVTLEAMKMEHIHAASAAGRITALHASVGEQVAARRVLAEFALVQQAAEKTA